MFITQLKFWGVRVWSSYSLDMINDTAVLNSYVVRPIILKIIFPLKETRKK